MLKFAVNGEFHQPRVFLFVRFISSVAILFFFIIIFTEGKCFILQQTNLSILKRFCRTSGDFFVLFSGFFSLRVGTMKFVYVKFSKIIAREWFTF